MNNIRKLLEKKVVEFNRVKCKIIIRPYCSGRIYMELQELTFGPAKSIARVTLDIDTVPIISDMIIVKSYRENEGMYEALLKAEVIKECERKISVGNEFGLICFLNLK